MATAAAGEYREVLVFLATAGVVVPLFHRLRVSPVLGFLLAGLALGPSGLGRMADHAPLAALVTLPEIAPLRPFAELGVVFLMFMLGLEVSLARLRAMRRLIFGLGLSQVVVTGAALGTAAWLMALPPPSAIVLGMALCMSSTAVIMPVLAERGRLKTGAGRIVFAVLLAQDIAVAPILIALGLLSSAHNGEWFKAFASVGPAALALLALAGGGRLLLRPLFGLVARTRNVELFLAACLLVVVGTATIAAVGGLSMALGAFVAGLLLAETEFRREVETLIDPFKGLLLGIFFLSVGAELNLAAVLGRPLLLLGIVAGLIGLKAALFFGLARAFKAPARSAFEAAVVLGPAGEFAFVVLAQAGRDGLIAAGAAQTALAAATVSLFLTPLAASLAEKGARRLPGAATALPPDLEDTDQPAGERVLVIGFGRVGRLVGDLLSRHDRPFVAVDSDPELVREVRKTGQSIFFGDASRTEFLKRCGVETTAALVVTMDVPEKVDAVVRAARSLRPDLTIVARARDERHAAKLYRLGASDAVPETIEASLQLAENTLVDLGVPMGTVLASIHARREEFRRLFQEASLKAEAPARPVRHAVRRRPLSP